LSPVENATGTHDPKTAAQAATPVEVAPCPGEHPPAETPPAESHVLVEIEAELQEQASESAEELAAAPSAPEEAPPPRASTWDGELPEYLGKLVDARLALWRKMLLLENRRNELRTHASTPEIRDELARQSRELQRIPQKDSLEKTLLRLTEKLKVIKPQLEAELRSAANNGKSEIRSLLEVYYETLGLGFTQVKALQERHRLEGFVTRVGLPAAKDEPVFLLCRKHALDADALFGWTFYAMGVLRRLDTYAAYERAYQASIAETREAAKQNGGLMSKLLGGRNPQAEVRALDAAVPELRRAAEHELKAITPQLSEMYWKLYEDVAWLLASDRLGPDEVPTARAMLRYGLVATHPGLISPEVLEYIRSDCSQDVYEPKPDPEATHVLYADEYIVSICKQQLSVSPDEEIELNGRGGPEWKADRVWRSAVSYRLRHQLYSARNNQIKESLKQLEQKRATDEKRFNELRSNRTAKAEMATVAQELAVARVNIGRLSQAADRLDTKLIPDLKRKMEEGAQKLGEAGKVLSPEMIVRREAKFIRRLVRWTARLKEPFPQFILRDAFVPGRTNHISRRLLKDAVAAMEKADRLLFHEVIMPNKRLDRRITVRLSPAFVIVPGKGELGLSVSPRKWDDFGRLVLPLCTQRQGVLQNLLIDMLSDFRWDCSKEEAGIDWITADALCAAYASVRWNCRRYSDQVQKSLGFDRKAKDRQNWRVHYRLFVTSVAERGRLLFSRCADVYKVVVKYIGLPPGVEALKRD